jgi:glucosamine-6-phosphate deaminase
MTATGPRRFRVDALKFEVYESREAAGHAAALAAADAMRSALNSENDLGVIFATGVSQLSMLAALTSMENVPWNRIVGFHMDEYENIGADHFASFRRYLRHELTGKVPIKEFHEVNGSSLDIDGICSDYAAKLKAVKPQLCLLGIGENGHLAFNDPNLCDFSDPLDVRLVKLDQDCRTQQVAEGWFPNVESVPTHAITVTIPALIRVSKLIVSAPGIRKANIVRKVIEDSISVSCPATLLKTHPDATVYLDDESSSALAEILQ